MFWASPFYEWAPFAESLKWDIIQTHNHFPVRDWVAQKIREMEFIQSQRLRHAIFQTRHDYDKRVVDALSTLPDVADLALGIYLDAAKDFKARQNDKTLPQSQRPTPGEVKLMIDAADKVVEMKQRSLMMHKFNVEFIRRDSLSPPAAPAAAGPHEEKTVDGPSSDTFEISIIGGERMKATELQQLMFSYIDQLKPAKEVEDDDDPPPEDGED